MKFKVLVICVTVFVLALILGVKWRPTVSEVQGSTHCLCQTRDAEQEQARYLYLISKELEKLNRTLRETSR